MKKIEPLVLPTQEDREESGNEQVKDTRRYAMKHWDEYTPEYDGDDHLSDTNQTSEVIKIGVENAASLVRHLYLKHILGLLWNDLA